MNKGPVLIVNDDVDDKELLQEAWSELGFPIVCFFSKMEMMFYPI
jgi:hypothetical protein